MIARTLFTACSAATLIAAGEVAERGYGIPGAEVATGWTAAGFVLWYAYHMTKRSDAKDKEFMAELKAERELREKHALTFQCRAPQAQNVA